MHAERHVVTITTDATQAGTGYTAVAVTGRVLSIAYVKSTYADGVDFTITAEATGEAIWTGTNVNASTTVYPRTQVHSTTGTGTGTGLTYDGTRTVCEPVTVANDRVKIVVAAGGDTKTGTFHVVIG